MLATRVDGLPAGAYRLDAEAFALRRVRDGGDAERLRFACLGQELAGDAAAAVVHAADLHSAVRRGGDRAYRHLGLDAGIAGERMNLAVLAEGLGVSGIGGYFDQALAEQLGAGRDLGIVYVTVLGTLPSG